ncbi:putative reverse transcriptase domain, ribonuclease H-like domain, aspartic peptidase domain protein [Tanacetum coccineum]
MVQWILQCVTSVSFSICVNGERFGYFKGGRGLRQDDLLMFCHGDIISVSVIKEAIKDFGVIFGLLPNYCKSSIIFGSISMEDKQYIFDSVCYKVEKLPVKYLGVPITSYIGTCHSRLNLSLSDISGANPSSNDFPGEYRVKQYLPDKIAKPIIELCSLFKQICSATLMEDDMLKAQIKVVNILCDLELIYPPALFDSMIHLVIYLPLEALEGGPIRPWWMFPFERYMKKLKGYVRNKAKPEGSIAEGYVAEEALTFSSHYFWDVTMKFNRPDCNFDAQELKKVKWYVLHNSPEIDTYRSQFKSLFPNKDMKKEFPDWFGSQIRQRHIDNDKDPELSTTSELFTLACGPTWTPISVNSYVVDGVRYVVHSHNERRTTQNSGICSPGPDEEMYYGRKVKRLVLRNNMTQIDCRGEGFRNDQKILVTQVKQVFYLKDKAKPHWKVVEHVNHKKFSNGGVIVVEDDPDIIHFDNSSDLPLSTSLNDLDNATLHIDGQSTEVDAPPDIIDVVDEDDDIINDEDALPNDLADSDDEDLINVNDDGVDKMSADVARSHGGDGGGEDRPPSHYVPTGYGGCFANRGKGKRKPYLGGRAAGRLHTRDKTRNLSLKEITDKKGPVPIRFEVRDKQTLMPLGDHAAHWSSYIGEIIRGVPSPPPTPGDIRVAFVLYYPSWLKVPKERKAALITDIGTQFDLRPHMESPDWTEIDAGIQQHLQKAYNTNKAAFKAQHWVIDPETGTYNVEKIRRARPEAITAEEWDKYIQFWNDPRNIARAAQNRENRAKSTVISRQGSRSLARLRDEMRQSSATQEYPSLIDTFFVAHTVNGVFTRDEDRLIYEEMRRLEAMGTYTDDEINRLARRGKQRGHIPGVGRVLPARATASPKFKSGGASESGRCGDDEESADVQEDEDGDGDS